MQEDFGRPGVFSCARDALLVHQRVGPLSGTLQMYRQDTTIQLARTFRASDHARMFGKTEDGKLTRLQTCQRCDPLQGMAPELVGDTWLNAEAPLRLADLQGSVVLLEMWTFGCINCRNTLPAVKDWHARYAGQGLVVIGNHYPEFDYEADLENLKQAVADLDITYPVVQDNAGENFLAYRSRYWPTLYLIDKQGRLRYTHIGEGAYDETEHAIATLLSEDPR